MSRRRSDPMSLSIRNTMWSGTVGLISGRRAWLVPARPCFGGRPAPGRFPPLLERRRRPSFVNSSSCTCRFRPRRCIALLQQLRLTPSSSRTSSLSRSQRDRHRRAYESSQRDASSRMPRTSRCLRPPGVGKTRIAIGLGRRLRLAQRTCCRLRTCSSSPTSSTGGGMKSNTAISAPRPRCSA